MHDAASQPSTILLIGPDAGFLNAVAGAAGGIHAASVTIVPESVEQAAKRAEIDAASVIVVDIDPRRRESLIALQGITMRCFGRAPVIVVADAFDDALVRWLLQIRVSDFLRKPVEPKDVLKACIRSLKATSSLPEDGSQIISFLSPAGGVGTTTLAIETAMLLRKAAPKDSDSTCLVDLDFQNGTCADYLDLEPRLDLDEIGPHPERLDLQLLEVMFSRHGSGLCLLAAKGRPAERSALDTGVVTRLLDLVSSRFENVVIDLPRSWERWTDHVLLGSNRVYVVSDMTVPGLRLGRRLAAGIAARLPEVKGRLHKRLIEEVNLGAVEKLPVDELRREIHGMISGWVVAERLPLNAKELDGFVTEVMDEMTGLGPLEALLKDPSIADILINGHQNIFVERRGLLEPVPSLFKDEAHLMRIIQKIVSAVGRRVDESSPLCDARLLDGSRFNCAVRPIGVDGPLVSIRKFSKSKLSLEKLVEVGAIKPQMAELLAAAVKARITTIVSGGTGSGKTTMLNALSAYISHTERLITIEDAAELQLQQPHVARMETRPPNIEGKGEIRQRDLVKNALRMRPERIILGECRGEEAFDMLQAMNTGHEGSMATIHANNPREAISRLEQMIGMAGLPMSQLSIRGQISAALRMVVQLQRLADGKRRVTSVAEITGMRARSSR